MVTRQTPATIAETEDQRVGEPVVLVALLEHVLQRAQAHGEQADAEPVDRARAALLARRILEKRRHQERRRDGDRHVDEEAPVPGVVVGDPAAERGPERRRDDDAEQEDRLDQALLLAREDLPDRGLRGREQRRAAGALDDAPDHELDQRVRGAAEKRGDREQDDRGGEVAPAAEPLGEERGHRQDDDVREDVAGADPADLLLGGAEIPGHLRQRHVDDRGVEHLHDRGGDEAEQDEPAGAPDALGFVVVGGRPAVGCGFSMASVVTYHPVVGRVGPEKLVGVCGDGGPARVSVARPPAAGAPRSARRVVGRVVDRPAGSRAGTSARCRAECVAARSMRGVPRQSLKRGAVLSGSGARSRPRRRPTAAPATSASSRPARRSPRSSGCGRNRGCRAG